MTLLAGSEVDAAAAVPPVDTAAVEEPLTPAELLGQLRSARAAAVAAEVRLFVLAAQWADAHPDTAEPFPAADASGRCRGCGQDCPAVSPTAAGEVGDFNGACPHEQVERDPEGFDDPFLPPVAWHAAAPLGAALGRSTKAGRLFMRDALLTRHRLPRLWERVVAGQLEPWRARRIAALVVHAPRDVAEWLDVHVAPVAHKVGAATLDRLSDEAMLRLHPEQREAEQLEGLDRRHATFERESINHTGIAEMVLHDESSTWAASCARDPQRGPATAPGDNHPLRQVLLLRRCTRLHGGQAHPRHRGPHPSRPAHGRGGAIQPAAR